VCIMLTYVLSGCHGDCRYVLYLLCVLSGCYGSCRYVLYLLVFSRVVVVIVGMYCIYLCSLGLSW
jgi:hypothetical protein